MPENIIKCGNKYIYSWTINNLKVQPFDNKAWAEQNDDLSHIITVDMRKFWIPSDAVATTDAVATDAKSMLQKQTY